MTRMQSERPGEDARNEQDGNAHENDFAPADPALDAIARWKQAMRERVAEYFSGLRRQGAATVRRHSIKGRSFVDLSIEGVRFKGQVRNGPVVVVRDDDCPLSSASITFGADYLQPGRPPQWAICNYRTQRRISLGALSLDGVRAVACEFGLVVHGMGETHMLSESECFVSSRAYAELQAWVQRYSTLARKLLRDHPEFLGPLRLQAAPPRRSRYRSLREFEYFTGPVDPLPHPALESAVADDKGKPYNL